MPVIKIVENEITSFTPFDATENVVLVPMLYARNYKVDDTIPEGWEYTEAENIPGKKYVNFKTFRDEMSSHAVTVTDGDEESTTFDKSYIMIYELLLQGLSVVVKPITYENVYIDSEGNIQNKINLTIEEAYTLIEESLTNGAFDEFNDKNTYNIKFVTSGGYANFGKLEDGTTLSTFSKLLNVAETRGDAIALMEFRPLFSSKKDLLEEIIISGEDYSNYAAAFFPWCLCRVTDSSKDIPMPASFCYLSAYANSASFNANWFAAAGVNRGRIPNLVKPLFEVGEALMHILQGDENYIGEEGEIISTILINPIYNAGTYGYRLWGNRTLNNTTEDLYTNFLNVRVLLCDIKKQIYHAAMRVTFEPNDDIVWVNFKTLTSTPLERMKSGRGISWYKWVREYPSKKAELKATLTIKPIEAVESFNINVVLTDEEASINEQND